MSTLPHRADRVGPIGPFGAELHALSSAGAPAWPGGVSLEDDGMALDQRASRARILEGALTLLSTGQCADLTVEALARYLKMSKGTLYRNFQSKDHILIALVVEACEAAEAESDWAKAGGTAAQQLTELAAVIGRYAAVLPRALIIDRANTPAMCTSRMRATRGVFATAAREIVERGIQSGEFDDVDPSLAALMFVASTQALVEEGAQLGDRTLFNRVALVPSLLLAGLGTRGTEPSGPG